MSLYGRTDIYGSSLQGCDNPLGAFSFSERGDENMSNCSTLKILMLVLTVIFAAVSQAEAIPALINYQGEVRDTQGNPLDGIYTMQFRIYSARDTGSALWGEQQTVDVNNGIYNVYLGAGAKITGGDDLGPTIFSSGDRWLEVTIEGETLSPRQRISSVAFAFRASESLYAETAGDSDSLDGKDSSDFADSDHDHAGSDINSGIIADSRIAASIARDSEITWGNLSGIPAGFLDGTDDGIVNEVDPTVNPDVKDGITWSEIDNRPAGLDDGDQGITVESDPQVGTNATNRIPKWNGNALVTGSIYDNGKIGIGTTNPLKPLHVIGVSGKLLKRPSGMEAHESLVVENNDNSNIVLLAKNTADSSLKFADNDHIKAGQIIYRHRQDSMAFITNATNRMNITTDGNVGIGTTVPTEKLEVAGNLLVGTNAKGIKLRSSSNLVDLESTGTDLVINNTGQDTLLNVSQGNVGIGKWSPEEKLDVSGNVKIQGDLIVEGAVRGNIGPANGAPFPRPAYGSGWIYYAKNECKTLNHNIGGDVNNYVVDMQFTSDVTGAGINARFYGGVYYYTPILPGYSYNGAHWQNLNTTSITVCRGDQDRHAYWIRIRIWTYN
jgi:hypothetical protein